MKNWKTTVGGILQLVGGGLLASTDPTLKQIGAVILAIGGLILGLGAKDSNVTGGTVQQ